MVDLDDIFKQAMLLKKNKNNANNAINANNVRRCKVCGSYQLVETDDGDEMVSHGMWRASGVSVDGKRDRIQQQ